MRTILLLISISLFYIGLRHWWQYLIEPATANYGAVIFYIQFFIYIFSGLIILTYLLKQKEKNEK